MEEYATSTIKEVNDLTDELYESLFDSDKQETRKICDRFMATLRDIKRSTFDEEPKCP